MPFAVHGDESISEIMPHVLDRHGLSFEEPVSELPAKATNATDLFDVMISCLESALAG